jgi:hypothetical protein
METNILATAAALSDEGLLARLDVLAGKEREASVELVAHLAALDTRPRVYAALGYGSLFSYCTQALRLSEDAACNRIEAARVCRRFPAILDRLASGSMSLTSVRLVGRHLTAENHEAVLARAANRTRQEIDALVAELAPRPDVLASVRKLPVREAPPPTSTSPPAASLPTPRPIVKASAPQRYRVQFTIDQETHEKLRRVQALLRREIPNGDPGAIFDRALDLLLEKVEKEKLAATASPRPPRAIRPGTDRSDETAARSRHIPAEVKRVVWQRDRGRCAFVAPSGLRCTEATFLEFHHVQPFAKQGVASVANIALRCRRHNQYEAELIFGPHSAGTAGERRGASGMTRTAG